MIRTLYVVYHCCNIRKQEFAGSGGGVCCTITFINNMSTEDTAAKPSSSSTSSSSSSLPLLEGDEARQIDLEVTDALGRIRVLEGVATRIADTLMYHLLPQFLLSSSSSTDSNDDSSIRRKEDIPLLFVAGKGNNGANAIATARILHLRGFQQTSVVTLVDPNKNNNNDITTSSSYLRPNIQEQVDLYKNFTSASGGDDKESTCRIFPLDFDRIQNFKYGVIIDGILGTGITDPPRGVSAEAIRAMNEAMTASSSAKTTTTTTSSSSSAVVKILSIDIPSGLNHITGEAPGDCVGATWTLNLHMLKLGQTKSIAKPYIGELWSAESGLGFTTFAKVGGGLLQEAFIDFYKDGPIRKVPDT